MNTTLHNIPVGIIKKSKDPDKMTVTFRYRNADENFDGYACSSFDKKAFESVNEDSTLYDLTQDYHKKVCVSFKNKNNHWRNKWMEFHDFCFEFEKTRKSKEAARRAASFGFENDPDYDDQFSF